MMGLAGLSTNKMVEASLRAHFPKAAIVPA